MTTAIAASGLGKKYVLRHGATAERYKALRDVIASSVRRTASRLAGRAQRDPSSTAEDFWALRDVDFEIRQGDRVGVIGRNGAGKSTLLKILSRITEPTTGRLSLRGRVSSLLEVGTGFHPELTGRENIFLNGGILGMSKAEIRRRFDEIVAFSEIERFLDTPVKRYSSGMYVRLAFAVAAHLEPEILIVDEVLAVGDAAFQKKCLGKIGEVSREGRTVLFVSHNMSAVRQLCTRGIVLQAGAKVFDGDVANAIDHYQNAVAPEGQQVLSNPMIFSKPSGNTPIWIEAVACFDSDGRPSLHAEYEKGFTIAMDVRVEESRRDYYSALLLHDALGNNIIFSTDEDLLDPPIAGVSPGTYRYRIAIPGKLLKPGAYAITPVVCLKMKGKVDRRDSALRVEVQDTWTRRGTRRLYRPGAIIAPEIPWLLTQTDHAGSTAVVEH
ncbi:MAG TPA: ABC transporter ATP-binding protein [Myxococcota bacterium]|jgi:lipopolysaccharide transport system ATP-binding protein